MDKKTAQIIKEQIIGKSEGHMSMIPFSPTLHSMFTVLMRGNEVYENIHGQSYEDQDKTFAKTLRQIADALDATESRE